jgi:hypothetical protein
VGVKVVEAVLESISLLAVSTWCAANLWFINETTGRDGLLATVEEGCNSLYHK